MQKPPIWFTVIAVILVLWGAMGCFAFYMQHLASTPAGDEWTRAFVARQPAWFAWVYAAAVGLGLAGSLALLLRSSLAKPLYIGSLIFVIVQFGYVFGATELLAYKGAAATVPFPAFIFAVAAFQVWLASYAGKRGLLR